MPEPSPADGAAPAQSHAMWGWLPLQGRWVELGRGSDQAEMLPALISLGLSLGLQHLRCRPVGQPPEGPPDPQEQGPGPCPPPAPAGGAFVCWAWHHSEGQWVPLAWHDDADEALRLGEARGRANGLWPVAVLERGHRFTGPPRWEPTPEPPDCRYSVFVREGGRWSWLMTGEPGEKLQAVAQRGLQMAQARGHNACRTIPTASDPEHPPGCGPWADSVGGDSWAPA